MSQTLRDTVIFGLKTNIPQLQQILSHPEFVSGQMNTQFIHQHFPQGLSPKDLSPSQKEIAQLATQHIKSSSNPSHTKLLVLEPISTIISQPMDKYEENDMRLLELEHKGKIIRLWAEIHNSKTWVHFEGQSFVYEEKPTQTRHKKNQTGSGLLSAPMPGKIIKIYPKEGGSLGAGANRCRHGGYENGVSYLCRCFWEIGKALLQRERTSFSRQETSLH